MRDAGWRVLLRLWRDLPIPDDLRWALMWVTNPKFTVTVVAVVFNERGEVLLFNHTYRGEHPWALPGGWLKTGETPSAAIEREILEESCLRVRVLRPFRTQVAQRLPRLDLIFLGRLEGGDFRCSPEVSEARFFPLDALPPVSKGMVELIREAFEAIR